MLLPIPGLSNFKIGPSNFANINNKVVKSLYIILKCNLGYQLKKAGNAEFTKQVNKNWSLPGLDQSDAHDLRFLYPHFLLLQLLGQHPRELLQKKLSFWKYWTKKIVNKILIILKDEGNTIGSSYYQSPGLVISTY